MPCVPVSRPFIERLIGTVRREYLDRLFFWNSVDLPRKLTAFRDYYNEFQRHRRRLLRSILTHGSSIARVCARSGRS